MGRRERKESQDIAVEEALPPEEQETQEQVVEHSSEPIYIPPSEPVPNQVVITFAATATDAERTELIESVGGVIVQNIGQLNAVVIELPTEQIVEQVWGYSGEGNRDLVRGLVQRLRSKVEPEPRNPRYVLTEPGIGYYFARSD